MQYLEEKDIGLDTGFAKVPLVCSWLVFLTLLSACRLPGRDENWHIRPASMLKKMNRLKAMPVRAWELR